MCRKGHQGFAGDAYCCTLLSYSASSHQLCQRPGFSLKTSPFPVYLSLTFLFFSFPGLPQKDITVKRFLFFLLSAAKSTGQLPWAHFETVSSWKDYSLSYMRSGFVLWMLRDQKCLQRSHSINLAACLFPPSCGGRWEWESRGGGCYWANTQVFVLVLTHAAPRWIQRDDSTLFLSPGKGAASEICHVPILHSPTWPAWWTSLIMVQTPSS